MTLRSTVLTTAALASSTLAIATPAMAGFTPTITSVTPSSGSTEGGTSVVLQVGGITASCGSFTVSFGGVAATTASQVSNTQFTATTPAHVAGPVTVALYCLGYASLPNGFTYVAPPPPDPTPDPTPDPQPQPDAAPSPPVPTSSTTPAAGSTVPAPAITGITPGGASAQGGQPVVVTGTNLGVATAVTFASTTGALTPARFHVGADGHLAVTVPPLRPGVYSVVVTTPGGSAMRTGFLVVEQTSAMGSSRVTVADQFTVRLAVGPDIASVGASPRFTLGAGAVARAATGTACHRSAISGTPRMVRITCPVTRALRAALGDGTATVRIRMTARVAGSSVVIPLRPVAVSVRRRVLAPPVTG